MNLEPGGIYIFRENYLVLDLVLEKYLVLDLVLEKYLVLDLVLVRCVDSSSPFRKQFREIPPEGIKAPRIEAFLEADGLRSIK